MAGQSAARLEFKMFTDEEVADMIGCGVDLAGVLNDLREYYNDAEYVDDTNVMTACQDFMDIIENNLM